MRSKNEKTLELMPEDEEDGEKGFEDDIEELDLD
jgi:hypothetical protein